nr:Mur ligase domain-containing protein [Candidatus Sumerlaeota bacterium]
MKLSLSVILSAAGGDLVLGEPSIIKYSFNTDTRAILPGEIFIALKGANFDGAQFAHDAFEKGAAGIIASALP